jgi:hypothetical protein
MSNFLAYGAIAFTFVLVTYTLLGGVIAIAFINVPTAALVATVALIALMIVASN